jgi:hypothetical protein
MEAVRKRIGKTIEAAGTKCFPMKLYPDLLLENIYTDPHKRSAHGVQKEIIEFAHFNGESNAERRKEYHIRH